MTGFDIDAFFGNEGILVFSEINIEDIPAPDHDYILDFFPKAGSVIVFAKEIPSRVYLLSPKEKTVEMLIIAESLDKTAKKLSSILTAKGIPARPVPLYLPVTITDGKVRGLVRLKQTAAAGGLGDIGKNSLLITPQYGPRVFLSGVVTSQKTSKPEHENISVPAGELLLAGTVQKCKSPAPLCTGCGLCVKKCPAEVFGPKGVDTFRCMTIRPWVHPIFVPVVKWLLKRRMLLRLAAPVAPLFARFATMPCSNCVTNCPRF